MKNVSPAFDPCGCRAAEQGDEPRPITRSPRSPLQRQWNGEANRLCGLEVYHQIELRRLLDTYLLGASAKKLRISLFSCRSCSKTDSKRITIHCSPQTGATWRSP
jgi:hypothetical protein